MSLPKMATSSELSQLLSCINGLDKNSLPSEDERHVAIRAARKLVSRLETPWDTLLHLHWNVPSTTVALKTAIDLGIFQFLEKDGATPKTSEDIARSVGADEVLVDRMMRHLAANDIVAEAGPGRYGPTEVTREISNGVGSSAVDFSYDFGWPCALTLPQYLAKTQYKTPTNVMDGNFQYAMKTKLPMFGAESFLVENPAMAKRFSELMVGYTSQRQNWTEIFPTAELLTSGSNGISVVDVGGNAGEDLMHFLKKHPEASGQVILQDLEPILAGAAVPEGIKPMPHNFFTPQPVANANAYFMHSILHDWPDDECVKILKELKGAMGPESRLLLNEHVIKPTGAPAHQTALDILMMTCLSTSERTEDQWHALLHKGGFKVKKIHSGRLESVIEAIPL